KTKKQNEYDNGQIITIIDTKKKKQTVSVDSQAPEPKVDSVVVKSVYAYQKSGRDPFLPLDKSSFIRDGLPNINNITLVGILYDVYDAIALFEEKKDNNTIISFSMKVGDPVVSGKLLRIEPNKVVFLMRESTFSYTVEKELITN
ncbi:MAG: hypothetical protein LBH98_01460, partial [Chitinispirillales bacterium]|nr:hypothetical protein [Chitinispirillales bacterium]